MKNKFAERLQSLIEEKEKSKRQIARETGISAQSISDWSTGKIQPTAEMIYILAEFFNCSSDFLLGLSDEYIEDKKQINKYNNCKILANGNNNF